MTLPRTVADVLADHVRFEIEAIDRLYLNVWQPRLAYGGGVAGFFTGHRGYANASTALMDPMSKAFVADIHHFIAARGVDLVHFAKGQRKDEVTQRLLAGFTSAEGVLYVGRAQEKSNVWGTQRRYHADGRSYAWLVRSTAFINFFYFYCVDEDFGPYADRPDMPTGQICRAWRIHAGERLIGALGAAYPDRWLPGQSVSRKARRVSGAL